MVGALRHFVLDHLEKLVRQWIFTPSTVSNSLQIVRIGWLCHRLTAQMIILKSTIYSYASSEFLWRSSWQKKAHFLKWKEFNCFYSPNKRRKENNQFISDPNICSIPNKCPNLARNFPQYPNTISFADTMTPRTSFHKEMSASRQNSLDL